MCSFHTGSMAGEFDYCHLHSQTDSEVRDFVFPSIADSAYHAFDASITKASGKYDSLTVGKVIGGVVVGKAF